MKLTRKSSRETKQKVPFPFVLERLETLHPRVRPMFGCHALYVGERLVLILRQRPSFERDNGVWLATAREHKTSLKKLFPTLRSVELLGGKETTWQVLPRDADDFEEAAVAACELVLRGDPRIGKVPIKKKRKHVKS
jgi:hypothetical protein